MDQLDGLRAFAVLMVLVQHFASSYAWLFGGGRNGVRLFFILSGFLITKILLRIRDEGNAVGQSPFFTLRQFYARRFLRIFPIYYLALFVCAAIDLEHARDKFFWFLLYGSNWYLPIHTEGLGFMTHLWSLAVEEQFYVFWPLLILLVPNRLLHRVILALIGFSVAWKAGFILLGDHFLLRDKAVIFWCYSATPACLDTLGAGALLAYYTHDVERREVLRRRFFQLCVYFGFPIFFGLHMYRMALKVTGAPDVDLFLRILVYDIGMVLVGAWLVGRAAAGFGGWPGKLLRFGPIAYLGRISYGVYLYHFLIFGVALTLHDRLGLSWEENEELRLAATAVISIVFSALSWEWLERPINDLKRRFPYVPAKREGDVH